MIMKNSTAKSFPRNQSTFYFAQAETQVISIDGVIGFDITAAEFEEKIKALKGQPVRIEISSPGGFVAEGLKIFNLIRNHDGHAETRLMGFAASMASYIAVAGDKVTAEDNAVFMIHNVWGLAIGDHRDLRKGADVMEGLTRILSNAYILKSEKSSDEIRQMMDDDTFLFGEEMVKEGFVDEIIKTKSKKDKKAALALVSQAMDDCVAKMKESAEAKSDLDKVAALIPDEILQAKSESLKTKSKKETGLLNHSDNQIPAANAGQHTEENNMNLTELLAQNPAAKVEHDALIKEKTAEGYNQGKKEVEERAEKAAIYLGKDSAYGDAIKALAIKAIKGETSLESLVSAVATVDEIKEHSKSELAKIESGDLDATPGQSGAGQVTGNGQVKTESDVGAVAAALAVEAGKA